MQRGQLPQPSGEKGISVECGVWMGFVSSVVMHYLDWNRVAGNRHFYLVDSFEGLSEQLVTEDEKKIGTYKGFGNRYAGTLDRATATMAGFKNVKLIKGYVPDILSSVPAKEIAYLHLDMNAAILEAEALKFFWPKMTPWCDCALRRLYLCRRQASEDRARQGCIGPRDHNCVAPDGSRHPYEVNGG